MKKAMLWNVLEDTLVQCVLCAHRCRIPQGRRGICEVRENREGILYSLVYGRVIAQAVDPIEKKPLFHFHPGSRSYSIATVGCNFRCTFCQNADISQAVRGDRGIMGRDTTAEQVVAAAQEAACTSIANTYTEPTMFFEFSYEIGRLAHERGIANVYVSNGYMTPEMLDLMAPADGQNILDAANIDLKAFTDAFYREQCGARLQPVLDALKLLKARGVWLEVTTLIIPGLNDSDTELGEIATFIAQELSPDTPWHVSRFHPTFRLTDRPSTPVNTVLRAREIGLEAGLHYVYAGNVPGQGGEDTLCPTCGAVAIQRTGFRERHDGMSDGVCRSCGGTIAGVGL